MADSDRSDYVCETCDNTVKSLCHACMETAQLRSTLDIHITENFDETATLLKYVTIKRLQCKSLILGGRFERNSDTESDYSDMPPLEETKKFKYDSDEDSDDLPPLVPKT